MGRHELFLKREAELGNPAARHLSLIRGRKWWEVLLGIHYPSMAIFGGCCKRCRKRNQEWLSKWRDHNELFQEGREKGLYS